MIKFLNKWDARESSLIYFKKDANFSVEELKIEYLGGQHN